MKPRLPISDFLVAAVLISGCSSREISQSPPKVVGIRQDSQGDILQQIVLEQTDTVTTQNFTPEGPHRSASIARKYYLDEGGKARREISWLNDTGVFFEHYRPVANSPLWIGVTLYDGAAGNAPAILDSKGQIVALPNKLFVVVFNANGIVAQHTFHAFWVNAPDEAFRIAARNASVIFRSPTGFKKFDVTTDATIDLASNPDSFPTDPLP
jgi:hypothetical protein